MSVSLERRICFGLLTPLGALLSGAGGTAAMTHSWLDAWIYAGSACAILCIGARLKLRSHSDSTVFESTYLEHCKPRRTAFAKLIVAGASVAAAAIIAQAAASDSSTLWRCLSAIAGVAVFGLGVAWASLLDYFFAASHIKTG